jgi:UDP-N-acetylmuramoylalanine--D-glutamate ligase
VPVTLARSMQEAVDRARSLATPGSIVLLSPACASFDQFRNFEVRGDKFRELVQALPGVAPA